MKANQWPWQVQLAVLGAGVLAVIAWKVGSVSKAAEIVGSSAVAAGVGVTKGVVSGVSTVAGFPTPDETFDDPAVGRWVIDNKGYFAASKWFNAVAFFKAMSLPEGSGTPPATGSILYTI